MDNQELKRYVLELRGGIFHATHVVAPGHLGDSLSTTEVFMLPYFEELHVGPKNPEDPKRGCFMPSKGHCTPGLCAVLAVRGFFPEENLLALRHTGSYLQGHPGMKRTPGVDMSGGSLNQGTSAAVGAALAARVYGESCRTCASLGDGEIEEGEVQEAAMFAGFRKLDNLVVIVDNNNLQIGGSIDEVNSPYPIDKKFEAFNLRVINVGDGNGFNQPRVAFAETRNTKGCPTTIVMKTVKDKDISFTENQVGWYDRGPDDEGLARALAELDKAEEM